MDWYNMHATVLPSPSFSVFRISIRYPSCGLYMSFSLSKNPFLSCPPFLHFLLLPLQFLFNFPKPYSNSELIVYSLDLGLGSLESGGKEVAEVVGGLVEVVAHPVGAEALGDDVEVKAVKIDMLASFI